LAQDSAVRAVFFDFGGVIVRMDRERQAGIEDRHGLPKGGLMRAITALPEWRAAEVGKGTEQAFLEALKRKLDGLGVELPFDIDEAWSMMWRTLDADVVRLVERLGARYDVGVLSNATLRLDDELREQKIDGLFKVIVNSSRVGMAKPDARIYHLAAERMGVEPSACVHVDDDVDNVEGARRAGFHGIHHQGDCATLERELRSLGVEW
jgi:putative hydrolase of the HAD superfamily